MTKCGKIHDDLGMMLDFPKPGKVIIQMFDYIQHLSVDHPEILNGTSSVAAAEHLFMVNKINPEYLSPEESRTLASLYVAELVFLCHRARLDLQTAAASLMTCMQNPDYDNYKKIEKGNAISPANTGYPSYSGGQQCIHHIKCWIDGSFGVHKDMHSHTSGMMSLGRGAIYTGNQACRQKLITKKFN